MNKLKLGLVILFTFILLPFALWLDPIFFGGTWEYYLMPCFIEWICFIWGVIVGGLPMNAPESERSEDSEATTG